MKDKIWTAEIRHNYRGELIVLFKLLFPHTESSNIFLEGWKNTYFGFLPCILRQTILDSTEQLRCNSRGCCRRSFCSERIWICLSIQKTNLRIKWEIQLYIYLLLYGGSRSWCAGNFHFLRWWCFTNIFCRSWVLTFLQS